MLLSMFFTCAAVEPSETLVPVGCCEEADAWPDLSLPVVRVTLSPAELAGSVLPGLSIFTVILSNLAVSKITPSVVISAGIPKNLEQYGFIFKV